MNIIVFVIDWHVPCAAEPISDSAPLVVYLYIDKPLTAVKEPSKTEPKEPKPEVVYT
jgi:hypothetical protein